VVEAGFSGIDLVVGSDLSAINWFARCDGLLREYRRLSGLLPLMASAPGRCIARRALRFQIRKIWGCANRRIRYIEEALGVCAAVQQETSNEVVPATVRDIVNCARTYSDRK
jgi:hypothetical protein